MLNLVVRNNAGRIWYYAPIEPFKPFYLVGDTNTYMIVETDKPLNEMTAAEIDSLFPEMEKE